MSFETSEGKSRPGDNPNKLNAKPRQSARPKTRNSTAQSNQTMRLGWIDPLPQVDTIFPLGLEPNVESIPAGEVELDFNLPETIAKPFADTVTSVGDRIQLVDDDKENIATSIYGLSFFKAARQLYSTMLDHEKAVNQPLKAVYYDETPIPAHMSGALGIIGHMKTKVGDVLVKDAGVLFKRWTAAGVTKFSEIDNDRTWNLDCSKLVWADHSCLSMIKRLASEKISQLVKQRYRVTDAQGRIYSVSMPQLTDQALPDYYDSIPDVAPNSDQLRVLTAALQMSLAQFRNDDLPHDEDRADLLTTLDLLYADGAYEISALRDQFELLMARYTTDFKWRVESIFKVGPPPAGTSGYGAQTVSSTGNTARWQFPLSDADINIGYLFSPSKSFSLFPKMVGYSKRAKEDASASFANSDAKKFYAD